MNAVNMALSLSPLGAPPAEGLVTMYSLRGVTKSFGNMRAVDNVSLDFAGGEVVALVGDNGAGKSTLIKVLNGFHSPDSGSLEFLGERVSFASPADARGRGIETVYQGLALVDELSLWRNFYVGREVSRGPRWLRLLDERHMQEQSLEATKAFGVTRLRSAEEPVRVLSGGERQAVAIARAWHFGARLLLLDEPTSALSVRETRKLAASIVRAKEKGAAIVIVDHNIGHVHPIADRLVLLENGAVLDVFRRDDVTAEELSDRVAGTHRLTVPGAD
jgi:simple sugar transport system ATP-binding protein